jgi:hypothetical protein
VARKGDSPEGRAAAGPWQIPMAIRSRRAVGPRAMVHLVLDRSEHAGMLTQIEGGHFAAGQPTRYLPQSLLLLSRRGCRVGAYDLNDLEPFEFRVRNRERPTGSRIAMGGAKRF